MLYRNQIKHLGTKRDKVREEYSKVISKEGEVEDGEFNEAFFSFGEKKHKVEKRQLKSLVELTVDDTYTFKISELFYSMLFKHQTEALQWLLSQHVHNKGSILADEMGLGKTISAIALISTLFTTHWESFKDANMRSEKSMGPFLIVCPATVISQWVQELKLWTTSLPREIPVLTFQGLPSDTNASRSYRNKEHIVEEAFKHDGIVITSYEFLRSDIDIFTSKGSWFYVFLDEAQKIKNSESQIHKAIMTVKAHHRVILSGTPM